ncbi:MAG: hypothetical protein JNK87_04520 [Bryobacterales bacterium]|nr:hypothetical protein [Bryobacterales bacterium]
MLDVPGDLAQRLANQASRLGLSIDEFIWALPWAIWSEPRGVRAAVPKLPRRRPLHWVSPTSWGIAGGRISQRTCASEGSAILAVSAASALRMIVIAGPPGSGKSTLFPASTFGVDFFNADDRAAKRNDGSYLRIPPEIRREVDREFEAFIADPISDRKSFAFETTLRSTIFFEQTSAARAAGFLVEMRYVALSSFATNLERVEIRADKGDIALRNPRCGSSGKPA